MAASSSIQVLVVSGSDLPRMDFPGKIDAYVSVKVEDPEREGAIITESSTSIVYKDYDPHWNHVFSVPETPESQRYVVRFHVFDKDLFRSEDVGEVVVPLSALLAAGAPQNHPITLAPKVTPRAEGQVPSLKVGASITRASDMAQPSVPDAPQAGLAPLKVTVTVLKASSLPKRDLFGKIDPYVVVTAVDSLTGRGLFQCRTEHISREYNPTWNFTQSFDIIPDPRMRPRLEFLVYDKDNRSKDDASGFAEVAVQQLPETALSLRLAPGTRPSGKSAVSQLWVSVSVSGPVPEEWASDLVDQSGISVSLDRNILDRLAGADPAVELRVQAVRTMDQPALDHHFNMALLLDIKKDMDSGDILLFRGSEAFSMQIRFASRSNWSHSAILVRSPPDDIKQLYHHDSYLQRIAASETFPELREAMLADDVFVFEAETDTLLMLNGIRDGLQLVPITYWLSKYYEMCGSECLLVWRKLIRQTGGVSLDAEQRSKLHMWLRDTAGRRYKASKFRQVNGVFKTNRRKDYSTFFCSELVTATLAEVGVMPSSTIGTNFLPVDLASEERHDGRDIVLNEPFKFLRERRLRLVPPTAQVDSGTSAFAITDTVRFKLQKAYGSVRPFEELIAADRLSGNADIEVLKTTLLAAGDAEATRCKEDALGTGWIRPYLAIVSLHPLVRLQIAMLLQVDITAAEWYGNPHREADAILHKLVLMGGQPDWASILLDCADNFYEDTKSLVEQVASVSRAERHAASCGDQALEVRVLRPLEIAVISIYRPLVQQRFPSSATDEVIPAAPAVASLDELRDSLGERARTLDIVLDRLKPVVSSLTPQQVLDFCVFMVQGGGKKLVQIVNEQWSVADSKKSVRSSLPLIFAQLSLQILLLFVEGIGSLRTFYPDVSAHASSSSASSSSSLSAAL